MNWRWLESHDDEQDYIWAASIIGLFIYESSPDTSFRHLVFQHIMSETKNLSV